MENTREILDNYSGNISILKIFRSLFTNKGFLFPYIGDHLLTVGNNMLFIIQVSLLFNSGYVYDDILTIYWYHYIGYLFAVVFGGFLVHKYNQYIVLLMSLLFHAIVSLIFYFAVNSYITLIIIAICIGVIGGIANPATRVFTYNIIDRKYLMKLFMPLMFLSTIGWIGYSVGYRIFLKNNFLAFIIASIFILLGAFSFWIGTRNELRRENIINQNIFSAYYPKLKKFFSQPVLTYLIFIILIMSGNILFNYVVPLKLIPQLINNQNSWVGEILASVNVIAMVGVIILNNMVKPRLEYIKYVLIILGIVSIVSSLFVNSLLVLIITWVIFVVANLYSNALLFSQIWRIINIKDGLENAMFTLIRTLVTVVVLYLAKIFNPKLLLIYGLIMLAVFIKLSSSKNNLIDL